jgi:hypothetical protein
VNSTGFYAVWAVLGAAALGLWRLSHQADGSVARPSVVLRRVTTGRVLRLLLVVLLMFLGWHLFAR